MDNDLLEEHQVPSGLLIGIKFDVSTQKDMVSIVFKDLNAMKIFIWSYKTQVLLDFHFS